MKLLNLLDPFYLYENRALVLSAIKGALKRYSTIVPQWLRAQEIPLTKNDRKIAVLKDKHRGRRCFIIGNGPSLKIADLDKLKCEITFACNKIYLAFDQTDWRPTYYSVYDVLIAENNTAAIRELNLCKIFGDGVRSYFNDAKNILWLRELKLPLSNGVPECQFSINALEGVYGGWTVLYLQMQLAFYLGIREIYLIGVDFRFKVPPSSGKKCPSGEVLEDQGEINHFHSEYRKPGETWTMPLLDLQYKAFLAAKQTVEAHGGSIFNASRKTALDIFPLVNIDDII